jgi:hypothetical protein
MKRAAALLRDNDIRHALAGSLAVWARGGPSVTHDVDFVVAYDDKDRALESMQKAGFRTEHPAEEWLYKAYVDDCLVDIIYAPPVGDALTYVENADQVVVDGVQMPVMTVDDVLVMKLGVLNERYLDFGAALDIARATREQISWEYVERQCKGSPFAEAFFVMCDGLHIRSKSV